ncbi:MAG: bifunctional hydroxymethylpyrimidine kinase/phosphomethylpyrimidine kinase [Clostridia bacterium]|nr:bifunctional hydroxymethylpyrimidine kinase/phosphomethylpyrimidine kinase [Clostridia bacterium]
MALLFIGSTVADVIIRTPRLPYTGDDVNITSQQVSLGGCAYNAFHTARITGLADCVLFSPVGTGIWGDWVRAALAKRGVTSAIAPVDAPNGCCYCLVEPNGERTFLCEHGAEYAFQPEWFAALPEFDGVYVCGLEIEEATGGVILDWLEQRPPRRLYFAPGPRILHIPPEKMARLMALGAVFHLNEAELCHFTRCEDVEQAARMLHSLTQNDVIVTLGERGAYVLSDEGEATVPGVPARVVDTIGAGDAHIGAVMAHQAAGLPLAEAVARANRISAAVVSQPGAELTPDAYKRLLEE